MGINYIILSKINNGDNLLINRNQYKALTKEKKDYKVISINCLKAFFTGGSICLVGQVLLNFLEKYFEQKLAISVMLLTFIVLASFLTAIGVFDYIGQFAHAGTVIPITGFSNSMTSSALEYKSEGFLLGIGANTFKLAGSIIVLGTFFGYLVGLIKYLWSLI